MRETSKLVAVLPDCPRPTQATPGVLQLAARKLAVVLKEHLGTRSNTRSNEIVEEFDEGELQGLEHAVRYRDGFEIGKYLDDRGWDIDADLFAELDVDFIGDAITDAVVEWVSTQGIVPVFALGEVVKIEVKDVYRVVGPATSSFLEGTITAVDKKLARYTINVPTLGHVPPNSGQRGTTGVILTFEEIEAINRKGGTGESA